MTVAPAIAAKDEGGAGTQASSQISRKKLKCSILTTLKIRSLPKGIFFCPAKSREKDMAASAGVNCLPS